jgi:transcription elongation GreA/GreB family factor
MNYDLSSLPTYHYSFLITHYSFSPLPLLPTMIQKETILETCKELVSQRIQTAETAMKEAQESSNSEEKSSAGDKYETARAMGQLARDMNAKQLMQAKAELAELHKIDLKKTDTIKTGSLIETDAALYFIAVGLGVITIAGQQVVVLSPKSPLAQELWAKKEGDTFTFNKKNTLIRHIS